MTQTHTQTHTARCIRLNAETGDQCTHRDSDSMTRDCGRHAPKAAKASRKSTTTRKTTRRPAPTTRRRSAVRTRFHDDIDAADLGFIN